MRDRVIERFVRFCVGELRSRHLPDQNQSRLRVAVVGGYACEPEVLILRE